MSRVDSHSSEAIINAGTFCEVAHKITGLSRLQKLLRLLHHLDVFRHLFRCLFGVESRGHIKRGGRIPIRHNDLTILLGIVHREEICSPNICDSSDALRSSQKGTYLAARP